MQQARKWIVVLCLAAVLLTALSLSASGVLFAVLCPIWFFFAALASVLLDLVPECCVAREFPFLPVLTPRPPPAG